MWESLSRLRLKGWRYRGRSALETYWLIAPKWLDVVMLYWYFFGCVSFRFLLFYYWFFFATFHPTFFEAIAVKFGFPMRLGDCAYYCIAYSSITTPVVILKTEGSIRKMQKRALFHCKTAKKGSPNLTSPYVHSLFTIVSLQNKLLKKISHWGQRPEVRLSFNLK